MRRISILLLLIVLGCETMIEIDLPEYETELVATSHFSPDSIWSVTLHRSASIGVKQNVSDLYVEGASVKIISGTTLIDSLVHQGRGQYKSSASKYPLTETSYTLHVDVPGQSRLQASSSAPPRTLITDYGIELLGSIIELSEPLGMYRIWIEFGDAPGTNMYSIGVYRLRPEQTLGQSVVPDSAYQREDRFVSIGPGWYCGFQSALEIDTEFRGGAGLGCEMLAVTDRYFDGQKHAWSATLELYTPADESYGKNELLLVLTSYSNDYVEYTRTLLENQEAGPFLEPFSVYSNVDGGLGIFAGYTNTTVILPLTE